MKGSDTARMRSLIFDMLSCLAYLRSIDRLPEGDFVRLEDEARALLEIQTVALPEPGGPLPQYVTREEGAQLGLPLMEVHLPTDVKARAECPKCGDVTPKLVHLKRRPRGGLQCQACRHEYQFSAVWL